jgi:hypothetical protein
LVGICAIFLFEEFYRAGQVAKDSCCGLGDEYGRAVFSHPDDVDFLGGFVCVLELPFDAAGYCRPAVRQRRDEAHYHVRLVDQHKIPRVRLAVNIAFDLPNLVKIQADGPAGNCQLDEVGARPRGFFSMENI